MLAAGCSSTSRLSEGEVLLRKNVIKVDGKERIDREKVTETIRQQPNRRILTIFPLYLWAYNVPNPDKAEVRNTKRTEKAAIRNERRTAKGKEPIAPKPWGSWWQETVGEPPVVIDTALTRRSTEQISTWLVKHGWFRNEVSATQTPTRRRRARVVYTIVPGVQYTIDSLEFRVPDLRLTQLIAESRRNFTSLTPGDPFNIENLDEERTRLTTLFRNNGYYDFNKELIYFDVDTALGRNAVHLTLGLIPRRIPFSGDPDSLLIVPYKRYSITSITLADRSPLRSVVPERVDTLEIKGYTYLNSGFLNVKPKVLAQNVLFNPGDPYRIDRVTRTYQRMSALPIVRSTAILFEPVSDREDNTELNCNILITPAPKQNFALEGRGTNRGGFLGVAGTVSFSNRNIFGGGERLSINLTGGVEAQQLLTQSAIDFDIRPVGGRAIFNTLEFGPEVSLTFPKFLLPIRTERFAKSAAPRTTLRTNLSYQRRPDYERTRSFGSLAYEWIDTESKQWMVAPIEVSLIKIQRSEAFTNQLINIGDPFLINSFQDHFILSSRGVYTYSGRRKGFLGRNTYFYRADLESAGSILRGIYSLSGVTPNEDGSYEALGIKFAHFIKTVQELRYHRELNDKMSTAYRVTGGIGVPLQNLNVLPFEKSFFGGGANDIRAWQARTLGPGSYRDPERNFDKIGDILIEANAEYRFDLIDVLEGALFADAGNIWNIQSDPSRPGADFNGRRFLSEIALGVGTGFRFNFDFFLIRLDLGLQLRDPSLDPGERWLFQPKTLYNEYIDALNEDRPNRPLSYYNWRWNLNLGIGYPF